MTHCKQRPCVTCCRRQRGVPRAAARKSLLGTLLLILLCGLIFGPVAGHQPSAAAATTISRECHCGRTFGMPLGESTPAVISEPATHHHNCPAGFDRYMSHRPWALYFSTEEETSEISIEAIAGAWVSAPEISHQILLLQLKSNPRLLSKRLYLLHKSLLH